MIKFSIRNRWSGDVQFTADIECGEDASTSIKLGLAVRWGISKSADLRGADLRGADLRGANLGSADLRGANLGSADLRGADLRGANLGSADLRGANLGSADLRGADLRGALHSELALAQTLIAPEGDLIVWKKLEGGLIAKLLIPAKAKRFNASGRKCRAQYADVLGIWDGAKKVKEGASEWDHRVVYKVGKRVKPTEAFDLDRWNECSSGIHFYLTRIEAENH